jgi:hypothetical protein
MDRILFGVPHHKRHLRRRNKTVHNIIDVAVGGLVGYRACHGPKVSGFKPSQFLRAINHSSTSFGREVKPSAPCRKTSLYVKRILQVWK